MRFIQCGCTLFLFISDWAPLYRCTTICYPFASSWLSLDEAARTFMYRSLCGHCFHFSWVISRNEITESCGEYMFTFGKKENKVKLFQSGGGILHSHQAMSECSCYSASSPAFGVVGCFLILIFSLLNRCVLVSHYSFNFHFPLLWWFWASFPVLICYLYLLWWSACLNLWAVFCFFVFEGFLNWVFRICMYPSNKPFVS